MSIPTVSEISHRQFTPPAPPVARTRVAPETDAPAAPVAPAEGAPTIDIEVGRHQGAKADVYEFVNAETGEEITQFPAESVLNLVAQLLRRLETEGQR